MVRKNGQAATRGFGKADDAKYVFTISRKDAARLLRDCGAMSDLQKIHDKFQSRIDGVLIVDGRKYKVAE